MTLELLIVEKMVIVVLLHVIFSNVCKELDFILAKNKTTRHWIKASYGYSRHSHDGKWGERGSYSQEQKRKKRHWEAYNERID